MLARFSVAYERFCRLLLTIFVVNIAMLVHTLLGAVVLGFFPSCAAAQTTFRTWLRAEDRSMRAKEVWGIFHGAWKNELKQANLFGWPLAVCWVVLAIDYYMMNWHARGTFDVAVSGVLFVLALVLLAFTMLVWVVRANYDERPLWIVRTTLTMIVARPLCTLLQIGLALLAILAWAQWPGLLMVFGMSLPMFCTAWIVNGRVSPKKGGHTMESASQSRQADKAKPLVSIKDIAKEAGVSICTVSLVMNNKDRNRVSKAVAQRVRGTAQSMGYKPNSVARTLRTSRSYVLGFITDEIATTPYAGRVLVGAQEAARKLGYILLTVNTGNDRELENQEIAALRQYCVDGFLYAMMYHRVVEIPAELEGSPTVVVDSEDENRKIPSIYPDDEMAGYDATNRLIQAGCKRIVYYGSSITIIAQGERFAGYRRALADAGIPFDEQLVVNVEEATNAASEAGRVFDEIKPDGIFCFNDVRATFIYEAARERSVGIGTDVSVISIDNQPLITDVLKPALTTLELPHYEMGFEAVHQLVAMIDDEAATESLARSEDSIRRSENGPMTPLRCRIIERDSIVS